jgi:exosome complex component RRP41
MCIRDRGLVSKPANPRSIILSKSKAFNINEDDIITTISIGDNQMSDNLNLLETQVAGLKQDLASAKEENEALKLATEEAKDKEFASTVEAFEAEVSSKQEAIAELEETIKSTQARIAELEDALAQSQEDLVSSQAKVDEMHDKEVASRRKAALVEAGFENEEAEESLELYAALSDEAFDAIVAKFNWFDKKKKDDKKDEKEDKEEASVEASEEVTEEADETEAAEEAAEELEEAFEEVSSTEAALVEPEVDELQTTRASISEWLSSNVLNK